MNTKKYETKNDNKHECGAYLTNMLLISAR